MTGISRQDRQVLKYILLAQCASNAGKGEKTGRHNSQKAESLAYYAKDMYLGLACSHQVSYSKIKISISRERIIYFEWKIGGEIFQASFHFFTRLGCKWENDSYSNPGNTAIWTGIYGGSRKACRKTSKFLRCNII